eukprot:TRINITY_DN8494_c0_g1_i1.p1 TRINITY_DN8494_c0_g1~~TRINITY_DN8494_c0_g1_i1.p1  ORF type:complete len:850 (-),score=136.47 TRINITY_DN8494_c0_g1_i1:211-2760(-)
MTVLLLDAALSGNADVLRRELKGLSHKSMQVRSTTMQITDRSGYTALHLAVCAASIDCVVVLLTHGADPNCRTTRTLWTPLHFAVQQSNAKLVHILLAAGADRTLSDEKGRQPKDLSKQPELTRILEYGLHAIGQQAVSQFTGQRLWVLDSDEISIYVRTLDMRRATLKGWSTCEKELTGFLSISFEEERYRKSPLDRIDSSFRKTLQDTGIDTILFDLNTRLFPNSSSSNGFGLDLYWADELSYHSGDVDAHKELNAPMFFSNGKMWFDKGSMRKLDSLIGDEKLLICKAIHDAGFSAWFSGLCISDQLRQIYLGERPKDDPLYHSNPIFRDILYVTCDPGSFKRLCKENRWILEEVGSDYLVGDVCIRLLCKTSNDSIFTSNLQLPTAHMLFYDPYRKFLWDSSGLGLFHALTDVCFVADTPPVTEEMLVRQPYVVLAYFFTLAQGFSISCSQQHGVFCDSLLLCIDLFPAVVVEALNHVIRTQLLRHSSAKDMMLLFSKYIDESMDPVLITDKLDGLFDHHLESYFYTPWKSTGHQLMESFNLSAAWLCDESPHHQYNHPSRDQAITHASIENGNSSVYADLTELSLQQVTHDQVVDLTTHSLEVSDLTVAHVDRELCSPARTHSMTKGNEDRSNKSASAQGENHDFNVSVGSISSSPRVLTPRRPSFKRRLQLMQMEKEDLRSDTSSSYVIEGEDEQEDPLENSVSERYPIHSQFVHTSPVHMENYKLIRGNSVEVLDASDDCDSQAVLCEDSSERMDEFEGDVVDFSQHEVIADVEGVCYPSGSESKTTQQGTADSDDEVIYVAKDESTNENSMERIMEIKSRRFVGDYRSYYSAWSAVTRNRR